MLNFDPGMVYMYITVDESTTPHLSLRTKPLCYKISTTVTASSAPFKFFLKKTEWVATQKGVEATLTDRIDCGGPVSGRFIT